MNVKPFAIATILAGLSLAPATARTWVDSTGRPVDGDFVGVKGSSVQIRLEDGTISSVPIKVLSKADQEFVKAREHTAKADLVAIAVRRIDAAVEAGLEKEKLNYNESLNDQMFLRRIYLDLAGRIPKYKEVRDFLASRDKDKRQKVVIDRKSVV